MRHFFQYWAGFIRENRTLTIAIIIILACVGVVARDLAAQRSLRSGAPEVSQQILRFFPGEKKKENVKRDYYCYYASRKFAVEPRYCYVKYVGLSHPTKDSQKLYEEYRDFVDFLLRDGWEVGMLTSTHMFHDTYTKLSSGDQLKDGDKISLAAKKKLPWSVTCKLYSGYNPDPSVLSSYVLEYDLDCFYKVLGVNELEY